MQLQEVDGPQRFALEIAPSSPVIRKGGGIFLFHGAAEAALSGSVNSRPSCRSALEALPSGESSKRNLQR